MTDEPGEAYEGELRIEASPETVFRFFTDPGRMVRWMGLDAMLDARPSGSYRINVTGREVARGEFLEVVPNSRLVMSWGWESGPITPGSTRVEVDFIADGDGTLLRLRHFGLDEQGRETHRQGWEHYLARLEQVAAGVDPGLDPWAQEIQQGAE